MSNDYYITNLLNLKDENLVFSDGIHHEFIKGIKYTVISAKLNYSNGACPHCGCSDNSMMMKYGFKPSRVRLSKSGNMPLIIELKKQKIFCKQCGHYFLVSTNIVDKYCCISNQVRKAIMADLTKKCSMKDVAFDNCVSTSTVEGINNFIKVLKRNAFGFRRFVNFRTRIFITRNLLSRRF